MEVKLLVSDWDHSRPSIRNYLKSLASLNHVDGKVSVEGKMFKVTPDVNTRFTDFSSTICSKLTD